MQITDNIYVKSKNVVGKGVNICKHTVKSCHLSWKSVLQKVKELKIWSIYAICVLLCVVEEMIFNYQQMQTDEEMTIQGPWIKY